MAVFPRKQSALAQHLLAEFIFQTITQQKSGIRRKSDAEFLDGRLVTTQYSKVFASASAFGTPQAFLKKSACAFMDFKQSSTQPGVMRFRLAAENSFGKRDAQLLRDQAHGLRKSDVLNFLNEAEHVAGGTAAKAVIELPRGMNRERWRLLFVKRAQA